MRTTPALTPREVASSIDDLVAGATDRRPFHNADGKSGSGFERLRIDGRPHVLKVMHVDDDWIARSAGDLACRQVTVFAAGVLDALPPSIDAPVVGAARGFGPRGLGAAVLMADVGDRLVPEGDAAVPAAQHAAFVDHLAELSAAFWGWTDTVGLMPPSIRWSFFGPGMIEVERARGFPDPVPGIAARGWEAFDERAPADVRSAVQDLRAAPWVVADALAATPSTFVHGDWKMGNLGSHADGRTILLDCAYPGEGQACAELAWYLALNAARLPEPKEAAIARFRAALDRRGVDTAAGWWDRQLGLALLGMLVIFGWEKSLGAQAELDWWIARARAGTAWL